MRTPTNIQYILDKVLTELGLDRTDKNFKNTPARFGKWLMAMTIPAEEILDKCREHAKDDACFPIEDDDMVAFGPFIVYSLCPHHLLPVEYEVAVGYVPNKKAVGLSKIIRIGREFGTQPILQEEFAPKLADLFIDVLGSEHVIVYTKGVHGCMKYRGIREVVPVYKTAVRGMFKSDGTIKQEFYTMIKNGGI